MLHDKLLAMARDPEGNKLYRAFEGLVLERKASKSAELNFAGFDRPWRTVDWSGYKAMRDDLRIRQIREVDCLRILVHGPVGAGKSSFVNSVASIFQDRIAYGAAVASMAGTSFTQTLQTHDIRDCKTGFTLPFAICDIMGLENKDFEGLHTEDLVKVLQGHIKDGYKFNPAKPCKKSDSHYTKHPHLSERIHCLVSVIPADSITYMDDDIIDKMRTIRCEAADMKIPQMVVLTKVDLACPDVAKDLKLIYRSKKIKVKMQECSNRLGVPMNCVFPLKNYHEETDLIDEVNVLVLSALKHILDCADDHVTVMARSPRPSGKKK